MWIKNKFAQNLALILLISSFSVGYQIGNIREKDSEANFAFASQSRSPADGEDLLVINTVAKTSPAVVSIIGSAEIPKIEMCYERGEKYDKYFLCENGTETQRVGAGSGFIVSEDGYIVTNNHVVSDSDVNYTVILSTKDGSKNISARILARDEENDIAILKIDEAERLPYLNFGDSDDLRVGQTALAIGYALGKFDNSVSKGVVSGLSRSIEAAGANTVENLTGLIQTDAAINPGNSGGPLLDINGNVIGINVAMASAQNIGFAIPGNIAKSVYDKVRDN